MCILIVDYLTNKIYKTFLFICAFTFMIYNYVNTKGIWKILIAAISLGVKVFISVHVLTTS